MPYRRSRRGRVAAALAAATAIWVLLTASSAADEGVRSVTSHILFGVAPREPFTVLVNGEIADGAPVVSDSIGVLTFSVDEGDIPPVGFTVTVTTAAAPFISSLLVEDVTPTAAVVRWDTDRPATSQVEYGPAPGYGSLSRPDVDLVTSHSVTLEDLEPGTAYLVRALSKGEEGLPAVPAGSSFETLPIGAIGPPTIGDVAALPVSSLYVAVSWNTDRPASSQVRYGTRGVLDLTTTADTTLVRNHTVMIGPVVPQKAYTFVVLSACGGDTATCDPGVFATLGFMSVALEGKLPRVVRPDVHDVQDTCAVVRWATDRPCSTWVECGRGSSPESWCAGTVLGDCGYEAAIAGLLPNTEYTYRICAVDAAGAFGSSEPDSFRTAPIRKDPEPGEPGDDTTGVPGHGTGAAASSFSLGPNPATNGTILAFSLPEPARVRATIFSTAGRLVRVLSDREWSAGAHALPWDLTSDAGQPVASGAYLCAVESGGAVTTGKVIVVR